MIFKISDFCSLNPLFSIFQRLLPSLIICSLFLWFIFNEVTYEKLVILISPVVSSIRKYLKLEPMILSPGAKTGVSVRYDNPKEIGTDRIALAAGGLNIYGSGLLIIDFDTATTYEYIDEKGSFDIGKCDLITYANGKYYSLGKPIGKFGYSVQKKKKKK